MSGTRRRGRIDRAHVIRRGEDATRQLPSRPRTRAEHFKRRFRYLGQNSIRVGGYPSSLRSRYTRLYCYARIEHRDIVEETFFLRSSTRSSIFDRWCIHQRWFRDGTRNPLRIKIMLDARRGCDVEREENRRGINITHRLDRIFWK